MLDPLLGLALIVGRTRRLRLGANIVPLGRNPFLLAKALAQLDQLSDGRVLLSFVPGLDQPSARAGGDALERSLTLVRAWWRGETVEDDTSGALASAARPRQDPLEVWLGGRGQLALERAGRVGDGWLGAAVTPDEAGLARERIQAAAARVGRDVDPEHFGLSMAYARDTPDAALLAQLRARRKDVDPLSYLPVGREALRALIGGYVEAGLSKFVVRPLTPVASWSDEAEWLADSLLDLQT
jgi:alkanesulfonate monooxygenase SsuD/methylene tetrahydromethanopterin reductase-like flavin-dependent oxidoreductase (luciferase family)